MSIITRIPPSPTGKLHIGTARTALFNYLFAKHAGGTIVFRSEDTDAARSTKEYEDEIVAGLKWLGLSWDSFSRQSEHATRYTALLAQIVASGKAYVSKEPAKDDPTREVEVVRLRNPGHSVTFTDLVRGEITFDTTELGDFVIARSLTDALYHFAVVVDDMDSGITHVIRGEDHISNTARQILIQEALGAPRPAYAHLPLILDDKRAKLSKRSGTAVSVADYQAEGFLPEAMVNYLALLGWNPGGEREDYSLAELIELFTLDGIHKSGASWNRTKLLSVNQRWMRKLSDEAFITAGALEAPDSAILRKALPLIKDRAQTFHEAREMLKGELGCLFEAPSPSQAGLSQKGGDTLGHLKALIDLILALPEWVEAEVAKAALMAYADQIPKEEGGRGAALWPLRYALSGEEKSPDPFTLIAILGVQESAKRVQKAIAILEG